MDATEATALAMGGARLILLVWPACRKTGSMPSFMAKLGLVTRSLVHAQLSS